MHKGHITGIPKKAWRLMVREDISEEVTCKLRLGE